MQGLEAFRRSDPQAESLHIIAAAEANLYQGDWIMAMHDLSKYNKERFSFECRKVTGLKSKH